MKLYINKLCKHLPLVNVNVRAPSVGEVTPEQVASPETAILTMVWPFTIS